MAMAMPEDCLAFGGRRRGRLESDVAKCKD